MQELNNKKGEKMSAEYSIVSAKTSAGLEEAVAEAISNGLDPLGGIGIDTTKVDPVLYQAMYKKA